MSPKKYLWLLLFAMVGCTDRRTTVLAPATTARPVAIEVEVYDPVSNFVWENVGVRIVEAEVTGAGGIFPNQIPNDWFFSDPNGLVFFDSFVINDTQVGFLQNVAGQAVLEVGEQARVILELDALGFTAIFVEVLLTWDQPEVFVSVPFN